MPYNEIACDLLVCIENDVGVCNLEDPDEEREVDTIDCPHYFLQQGEYKVSDCGEAEGLIQTLKDFNIPYVVLDKRSLYFTTVTLKRKIQGVVRGSKKDTEGFRFWNYIDGGI